MNEPASSPMRRAFAFVLVLGVLAWIAHFTAPGDMHDDDQLKPAAYVLDIVRNGRWIVQTDFDGSITSKPPLYQWLCAIIALPRGVVDEWAMYIPSGAGIIGAALIACAMSARRYGPLAGACAGGAVVLNTLGAKHLCLARTDALFTLTVAATAWSALNAWEQGGTKRWTVFWLCAGAATMTKGPLGLVLGAGGLLAALFERGRAERPTFRGNHIPGIALFLVICAGWFALAVMNDGRAVVDKMIGRELVGHAIAAESGKALFSRPYQPMLYFLARFLPWSPIALLSLVRVWRRPARDDGERRLERFCACWFVLGIVIFSIPGHQRADLLLPLLPGAAVLVGRALSELARYVPCVARPVLACVVPAIGVGVIGWWNHAGRLKDTEVIESREARAIAAIVSVNGERAEFLADACDLQYDFGVKRRALSVEEARAAIAGGAVVLTRDAGALGPGYAAIEGLPRVRGAAIAALRDAH